MRRVSLYLLPFLLLFAACTDAVRIDAGRLPVSLLAVDGMITDEECRQVVRLSLTSDFFAAPEEISWVSGARVSVSCGDATYEFAEDPESPGTYRSVAAFKGEAGRRYRLDIDATVGGVAAHYSAQDVVPELGVRLDALDYLYSTHLKNMWTLAVWGQDFPGQRTRYLFQVGINGHFKSLDKCFELPDDHFDGMAFTGFTISALNHTEETRKLYGDCAKPLEEGDVITLRIYTSSDEYGEFLMQYSHLLVGTIPILTEQPSNLLTNITGTAPAVGYFGACAVCEVSCVVDDPYRTEYRLQP